MHWYLVHTKPRQERVALDNLERQGYPCYLPIFPKERLRRGRLAVSDQPLFPRYLFIQLGLGDSVKSWSPIRSTKGVSRLVTFGVEPAQVADELIAQLRLRELTAQSDPERLFQPGENVCLTEGPFAGIEGVFQTTDGEQRAMILIEFLSKQVTVRANPSSLRKID